jgi:hypothetical protein
MLHGCFGLSNDLFIMFWLALIQDTGRVFEAGKREHVLKATAAANQLRSWTWEVD